MSSITQAYRRICRRVLSPSQPCLAGVRHEISLAHWLETSGETTLSRRTGRLTGDRVVAWRAALATVALLLTALVWPAAGVQAASLPSGFSLETVADGVDQAVAFDFASGNRMFVARKNGRVDVFVNGSRRARPFVDISDRVNSHHDRGLLGIAVHPDFPSKPWVYLLYTYDPPETGSNSGRGGRDGEGNRVARLDRFTASASAGYNEAESGYTTLLGTNSTWSNIGNAYGDYSSEPSCQYSEGNYVRDCLPIDELSHTIGDVRFANDGALIVSSGDGATYHNTRSVTLRAQDLDSLAGKILRINPETGRGYSSNPWYNGDDSANRSKVLNYGLRNPFRIAIHPNTGELAMGDVGWRNWEEINMGKGRNFGWPCYEGANGANRQLQSYANYGTCSSLYNQGYSVTPPVYSYDHSGSSASVQVGDFYTAYGWPSQYQNALFFSDINRGVIEYLRFNSNGDFLGRSSFASGLSGITQIRQAPDGDLYFADIYKGRIHAIRYTPGNEPPTAKLTANRTDGSVPLTVNFDATGSSDPEGRALNYRIQFGNGGVSYSSRATATYDRPGTFTARLQVTDDGGNVRYDDVTINVGNEPPNARINGEHHLRRWQPGESIELTGRAWDANQSSIPNSDVRWYARLHHEEHIHPDHYAATGYNTTFRYPDHGDNTYVEMCFVVKDEFDVEASDCKLLHPQVMNVTIDSEPSGRRVTWDGKTGRAPMTVQTAVGGRRTLSVAAIEPDGAQFLNWSNGGAASHEITVSRQESSFTATFSLDRDVDGDGMNAREEAIFGGNPIVADADSDGDGTADLIDSAPEDPENRGKAHYIPVDKWVVAPSGYKYAGSRYYSKLRMTFDNPGTDILVYLRGFDIDDNNEVYFWHYADGKPTQRYGAIRPGRNNALTGITRFILSQSEMGEGRNYLEFRNVRPGERWGVQRILLKSIGSQPPIELEPLEVHRELVGYVGVNDPNRYVVRVAFDGVDFPSGTNGLRDMMLVFGGYDLEQRSEIKIQLNGRRIANTERGRRNGYGQIQKVHISASELKRTDNLIEFITRFPGRRWGIRNIRLIPLDP